MRLNRKILVDSTYNLTQSTTNKFWGLLAIIKSINGIIVPNKTYIVNASQVMEFLDKLFILSTSEQRNYRDRNIYVKFSTAWKEHVKDLTLQNYPNLNDAAIFYSRNSSFNAVVNTSQLKETFLSECKIRLNNLEHLFTDSGNFNLQIEEYTNIEFISGLEARFGKQRGENDNLSFESPFFIKSIPSELKKAPFIQTLYSGDKIKDLLLLSDSNLDELYPLDNSNSEEIKAGDTLQDFIDAIEKAGLYYSKNLILRFFSSLITKPFVILTGLSGSGKTKLAQAFVKWICNPNYGHQYTLMFRPGEELNSHRVNYKITQSDFNSVTFEQVDTETKVTLPYELIYEWIKAIKSNNLDNSTPTRIIRELVSQTTKYSTQLNSFESHLKAAAFELISRENENTVKNSQYLIVPVGADWTNQEPLLGYPNALKPEEYVKPDSGVLDLIIQANHQPELPHFLILDEMNLSHVERYFADFLSVMESKEEIPLHSGKIENGVPPKLKLPSNLFIIGTVNIDETTNMFSPKVLDRANTIEFRVTQEEIKNFLGNIKVINMDALTGKGAEMGKSFLEMAASKEFATADIAEINAALVKFFGELKKTGAEFGYRSATEILRLIHQLTVLDNTLTTNQKIDIAIMQKLLPKLHGSRRKLGPVLEKLGSFCMKVEVNIIKDVFEKSNFDFNGENVIYPLSLEKITRMFNGATTNGFASFAEA
jgi:hypothetical protein